MLSGVRILDLTSFLAGPYCTQILGDLGAEVIKVESPEGDLSRKIPPHFVGDDSAYFLSVNRNKRSIALDLKTPAGVDVLRQLAGRCDVLIESFRPGVLERLGLTYEDLRREKPDLVWCSITGFGDRGEDAKRPAYDMIVQAESGVMSLTGHDASAPARTGPPLGDLAAGMYAAIGINGALVASRATGEGRKLGISMYDCQLSLLSYLGVYYLTSGQVPGPQGAGHDSIPTYRTFTAGDGRQIVVTAVTQQMWERLCTGLGLEGLVDDPRFIDGSARHANRDELWVLLDAAFRRRSASAWVDELRSAQVPAALIRTAAEALEGPLTREHEMVLDVTGPDGAHARLIGNPVKVTDGADAVTRDRFPPRFAEGTVELLGRLLGYGSTDLTSLSEAGAFGPAGLDGSAGVANADRPSTGG